MQPTAVQEPAREAESGNFTFLSAWTALQRGWPFVVAAVVFGVVASGLVTFRERKIFRSTMTLEVDPSPPRPLGSEVQTVVDVAAGSYWNNREYYETQLRIITSSSVSLDVVRRLQLHKDAAFLDNVPPGATAPPREVSIDAAYRILKSRVSVEAIKGSRLVLIHFEDANPGRAQRLLSLMIETYMDQNIDKALASATSSAEWLGGQVETLKKELENNELNLHEYKKSHNILSLSLDDQSSMLRREMTDLNSEVTRVRAQIQGIASRAKQLNSINAADPSDVSASELLNSPALQYLRNNYIQARSTRLGLMSEGRGENHPEVLAASAREELMRAELAGEVRNIQVSVERDLAAAKTQAAGLTGLFQAAEQRALDLNLLEIQYRRHEREKINTERLYTLVLERSKESDLTRMMRFNNLRVVDPASAPVSAVRPNVPVNLSIGAGFGLLFGFLFAFGRERLDRSIKTSASVEQCGLVFLGALPNTGDAGGAGAYSYGPKRKRRARLATGYDGPPELLVHARPKSNVAEAARAIRTSIRFSSPDATYRSLLVTSAGPAEGKTTVACCIAIAMAQAGQRTLIVDCDLRRPRVHRVFGISNDLGTTSAVVDPDTLDQAIRPTTVENLYILPSGPHAPNPADLINSERFGEFLARLREKFDLLLIDSPPLLPVTDAAILATRVDGTVLVVRSHETTRDNLIKAARTLHDVGAKVVGTILNGLEAKSQRGNYYYSYYTADEPSASKSAETST